MSIEVTCRQCGEEFDSRHTTCPVCGDDGKSPPRPALRMNAHELRAWRTLIALGAVNHLLFGKPALDLRRIKVTSKRKMGLFCAAFLEVVGHTGANRRHVNRSGNPIFVVSDDPTAPRP